MEKEPKKELQEEPQLKKNKPKKIGYVLAACGIAAISFMSGFLVDRLTWDKEMRELARLKSRIQKSYYEEVTDEEFYDVLFDAINENILSDAYSWYMTPDEYAQTKSEAKGERSGLGLVFLTKTDSGEEQMLVTRVCGNSPAEEKGIVAGDKVIGFGDTQEQIIESTVFEEFSVYLSQKETSESFYVKLETQTGVKTLELSKENYVENYVFYRTATESYSFTGKSALDMEKGENALSCLGEDTAYIRLTSFNGSAVKEFQKTMDLFRSQKKTNLVLDLRANGGGSMNILQEIANYFCKNTTDKTPVVAIADYGDGETSEFKASSNLYYEYFKEESRICVLADNGTASASECLLGCMLDYGTIPYADICLSERNGSIKTYGKGIMQTTYPFLLSGGAVKLTTAKICWPKTGNCIHGIGITPDDGALSVAQNYAGDAEIEAAIAKFFS